MTTTTGNRDRAEARVSVRVYSTCPQSKDIEASRYLQAVADVSRWSEAAGCEGILVYTDNGIVDPWLVSQVVLESTQQLKPLVAIQPVYMHPYSAAKMVASFAFIHGRSIALNMLAGGFKNDLLALGDQTPHDERYERTVEYTQILMDLVRGEGPVTGDGRYYQVTNLRLTPAVPADLVPEVLMSGSSPAGLAASRRLGATAVKYPRPPGEEEGGLNRSKQSHWSSGRCAVSEAAPPTSRAPTASRAMALRATLDLRASATSPDSDTGRSEPALHDAQRPDQDRLLRPVVIKESWVEGDPAGFGVRVGIITRQDASEAWRVAYERFPEDRQGQITHRVAMQVSDSHWHQQLSRRQEEILADASSDEPNPYWLGPFQNYKTFCPYLVGSYERVSQMLAHYIAVGSCAFILDIPSSEEELEHIGIVFERAQQGVMTW